MKPLTSKGKHVLVIIDTLKQHSTPSNGNWVPAGSSCNTRAPCIESLASLSKHKAWKFMCERYFPYVACIFQIFINLIASSNLWSRQDDQCLVDSKVFLFQCYQEKYSSQFLLLFWMVLTRGKERCNIVNSDITWIQIFTKSLHIDPNCKNK